MSHGESSSNVNGASFQFQVFLNTNNGSLPQETALVNSPVNQDAIITSDQVTASTEDEPGYIASAGYFIRIFAPTGYEWETVGGFPSVSCEGGNTDASSCGLAISQGADSRDVVEYVVRAAPGVTAQPHTDLLIDFGQYSLQSTGVGV